jgi:hypothetical protein
MFRVTNSLSSQPGPQRPRTATAIHPPQHAQQHAHSHGAPHRQGIAPFGLSVIHAVRWEHHPPHSCPRTTGAYQHHLFPAPPRRQEIKATIMPPHRRPTASSCCVVPGPLPLHQKTALRPLPALGKRSPCEALLHQHWLRTASRRRPCPKKSAAKRHVWANPGACSLQTSPNRHIWQPFQSSIFPRCSIADHGLTKTLILSESH